jgi:hypothetical protein
MRRSRRALRSSTSSPNLVAICRRRRGHRASTTPTSPASARTKVWGYPAPEYEHDHRREPRGRTDRPANRNHINPPPATQTMAINPYALTPAPRYGRQSDRLDRAGSESRRACLPPKVAHPRGVERDSVEATWMSWWQGVRDFAERCGETRAAGLECHGSCSPEKEGGRPSSRAEHFGSQLGHDGVGDDVGCGAARHPRGCHDD